MTKSTDKNTKNTPDWDSWRSPIVLGIFILLASVGVWFLANAQSIVANI